MRDTDLTPEQRLEVERRESETVTIHETKRVVRPVGIVLDHAKRLPMAGRLRRQMRTVCDACREPITDEYFYGGFATGHRNLLLHEACTPEAMRSQPAAIAKAEGTR